jgi:hypothetical protein
MDSKSMKKRTEYALYRNAIITLRAAGKGVGAPHPARRDPLPVDIRGMGPRSCF